MSTLETPDNATLPKPNVSRGELRRQDAKGRPGQAKKDRIMLKKPTPEPKAPHGEAKSHLNDYVEEKPSHPGGRPSSFRPEYVKQAEKLCKLGATDLDLAGFFEVDVSTIWRWATKYPEFRSALKSGKEVADDRVERSLYQRAVGYSHDAVRVFMPAGARSPVYAPYVEHVPPDTTAAIFWLKNRRREEWRDVSRHEQTGPNGGPILHATDLSSLSDDELARLIGSPATHLEGDA
jgi:hypothetical protein